MNIIWSPLALDRVSEVAGYIAQDKPSAAEKWVKTIFRNFQWFAWFYKAKVDRYI